MSLQSEIRYLFSLKKSIIQIHKLSSQIKASYLQYNYTTNLPTFIEELQNLVFTDNSDSAGLLSYISLVIYLTNCNTERVHT